VGSLETSVLGLHPVTLTNRAGPKKKQKKHSTSDVRTNTAAKTDIDTHDALRAGGEFFLHLKIKVNLTLLLLTMRSTK